MNNEDAITNIINMFKNQNNNNTISPETIENMIKTFKNTNNSKEPKNDNASSSLNVDIETIIKIKKILDQLNKKDDPRSNLLLSLKPYLKKSRKEKVEQYIQFLNISKLLDIFNNASGGDTYK